MLETKDRKPTYQLNSCLKNQNYTWIFHEYNPKTYVSQPVTYVMCCLLYFYAKMKVSYQENI